MRICSKNQCSQVGFFFFHFLILNLPHLTTKDIETCRISLVKLLSAAQAHMDPPEVEVVCRALNSVLLPQLFTGTQSLAQSVELGRRMPCGQSGMWTFLLPENSPDTPDSTPAQTQPFPCLCVLVAMERKTRCRDQMVRTCSSRSPAFMIHPSDMSGHTTSIDFLVPRTIADWSFPSSFPSKFLMTSSYTWAGWTMYVKVALGNVRVDGRIPSWERHRRMLPHSQKNGAFKPTPKDRGADAHLKNHLSLWHLLSGPSQSKQQPMLSQRESIFMLERSKMSSRTTYMVCGVPCCFLTIWSRACMVCLEGSWRPDSKSAKLSSTRGHDTGSLAMGRRTCSLGCAVREKKYGKAGCASDTNSSDELYSGKRQNILIT